MKYLHKWKEDKKDHYKRDIAIFEKVIEGLKEQIKEVEEMSIDEVVGIIYEEKECEYCGFYKNIQCKAPGKCKEAIKNSILMEVVYE